MQTVNYGNKWSEDETILAFFYYCKIPFGKIGKAHPEIIRLAGLLGRTPSSVVLKMGNLAHFDPDQRLRNITGLKNASKTDKEVVSRFFSNWEDLTVIAEQIEAKLSQADELLLPGLTVDATVKQRVNQQFFREAVLSSYQGRCCITGINEPSLLIASHIKPWKDSDPFTERTNPSNGLCLNALHDRAFDQGLITVLPDYTVRVSSKIKKIENGGILLQSNMQKIALPDRFAPKREFLEYHNDVIFIP